MANKSKTGKKQTYYTWWHDEDAGVAESWEECESQILGKPGRNTKKHDELESAKEMKEEKLKQIGANKENAKEDRRRRRRRSESNGLADLASSTATNVSITLLENLEKNLANLQQSEKRQTCFNDCLEKSMTEEISKSNQLSGRIEDIEKRINSKIQEILIKYDQDLEETKQKMREEFSKNLKEAKHNMRKEFELEIKGLNKSLNHVQKEVAAMTTRVSEIDDKLRTINRIQRVGTAPTESRTDEESPNETRDESVTSTPFNTNNRYELLDQPAEI